MLYLIEGLLSFTYTVKEDPDLIFRLLRSPLCYFDFVILNVSLSKIYTLLKILERDLTVDLGLSALPLGKCIRDLSDLA